ncbi:hypothetical protein PR202_gb26717 [Eleusine coracana subsp. coracana]|uniref:Uncharacterized protein n=1 Tax=Eleusine coracana subsp. coracana TaxID=191504 RepID=A0AAV5FSK5_ELECO|nr:hypothetical protein QOZ80_1BG0055160 [Eleusine coracana subsp. coracana]GJN37731.1 hypothetical protein PR202_gb26717 [Eleusine coracana subsp. coracana]
MADDDQQAPQQRYWFPYWTSPAAPAPRPGLRPQLSRRDTRPAPPQPQPQPTRLSSRPSPARGHPLSPIGEPNRGAPPPAPVSAPKETTKPQAKPVTPPQPAAHPTKELDIVVPHEKIIHEPPSDTKAHTSKAVEKEKEKREHKEKDKEHKNKDKDGKEKKEHKEDKDGKEKKEKEKEHKDHKEKKEKEHTEKKDKDKHKEEEHDEAKLHGGGKLHKELKAGVADMVTKLGASAAPSSGHHHDRHASGDGTTVITLAGKNKGVSMKISHADRKQLDDGKQQEAQHGAKGVTAFVNSNVQVVNNSLVFQGSVSSSDPGVHLKLSTKSKNKGDGEEVTGGSAAAAAKKK